MSVSADRVFAFIEGKRQDRFRAEQDKLERQELIEAYRRQGIEALELRKESASDVPCPGFIHVNYADPGEIPQPTVSLCPEVRRVLGHRPGTEVGGYDENWDRECPTCRNRGVVAAPSVDFSGESGWWDYKGSQEFKK